MRAMAIFWSGRLIPLDEIKDYRADVPVGKYNFINKNRVFYRRLFGYSIFKREVLGMPPIKTAMAFGPPFSEIAKR